MTNVSSLPCSLLFLLGIIMYVPEYFSLIGLLLSVLVFNVQVAICVRKGEIKEMCFEIQASISKFAL